MISYLHWGKMLIFYQTAQNYEKSLTSVCTMNYMYLQLSGIIVVWLWYIERTYINTWITIKQTSSLFKKKKIPAIIIEQSVLCKSAFLILKDSSTFSILCAIGFIWYLKFSSETNVSIDDNSWPTISFTELYVWTCLQHKNWYT